MTLDEIVDRIRAFSSVLREHGYKEGPGGRKAWSFRYTNGRLHVDVRGSDWTMYVDETEVARGITADELVPFLVKGGVA